MTPGEFALRHANGEKLADLLEIYVREYNPETQESPLGLDSKPLKQSGFLTEPSRALNKTD